MGVTELDCYSTRGGSKSLGGNRIGLCFIFALLVDCLVLEGEKQRE